MRTLLLSCVASTLLAAAACHGPETAPAAPSPRPEADGIKTLGAAEVSQDVELLLQVMRAVHPGYTRYANHENTELLAVHDRAVEALRGLGETNTLKFYRSVSRYAASLRCDHTKTEWPEAFVAWRKSNPSHLPFRFITDGTEIRVSSAAMVSALTPGDRIDAIDGVAIQEVLTQLNELISVDGYTDHVKAKRIEDNSDLMGSALDHYLPSVFGVRDSLPLNVTRLGGDTAVVTVPLVTFEEWKTLPTNGPGYRLDFSNAVHLDFPAPGVAAMRIDTFVNYRNPVDPNAIYRSVLANLRARNTRSLILDLRQNGGGSTAPMLALIRALARKPFTAQRPSQVSTLELARFSPHLGTWDPRALTPDPERFRVLPSGFYEERPDPDDPRFRELSPVDGAFDGDVIVLVGTTNASGVTHLVSKLVDLGRVLTIGESTGGSAEGATAGTLFFLTLPNSGIKVRVPFYRQFMAVETFEEGLGVTPHQPVKATLDERLGGRDPVMEHALAIAVAAKPPPRAARPGEGSGRPDP